MSTAKRRPIRQRRLPRAERRAAIALAATRAFAQAGFSATSMADIAAAAGVTQLIVYRHFASKQALYRAALARASRGISEALARASDPGGFGIGARPLLAAARRDPAGFQLLWVHATREPLFESHARELREKIVATVAASMAERVPADALDWSAHAVFIYLVDSVLAWLQYGEPRRDELFATATNEALRAGVRAWARLTAREAGGRRARALRSRRGR